MSDATRRGFLTGAAAALGTLAWGSEARAEPPTTDQLRAQVLAEYRTLGKTGKRVSKIGVGTSAAVSPAVLSRAIDLGLNYIDTAQSYEGGRSETEAGKILKKRRSEVVLTTKWLPGAATAKEMKRLLDESLKRLQCDHVDFILVHGVSAASQVENPEVFEAFEAAKQAGKALHLGMSSHSPSLIDVTRAAVKTGRYEFVLLKYSFMAYPKLDPLLEEVHQAGLGIAVMKTRDGARHADVEAFNKGDGFVGSALRWASSNPRVGSAVLSVQTFDDLELMARVAGQRLASRDLEVLERYASTFDAVQCRWCGECGPACPSGVPVWEVDRALMYHDRYRQQREGMALYAALGSPASGCAGCAAPCEAACRFQIPIREQLAAAHERLVWGAPPSVG